MRLGHTKTLSCIMHGLVLRKKRGVRQPYIPGKMVGLGDALESSIESKFFTPPFQSSYRCGAKVWALHSTLR